MISIQSVSIPVKNHYLKKSQNTCISFMSKENSGLKEGFNTDIINLSLNECLIRVAPKAFLNKFMNKKIIENALQSNPIIKETLKENGLGYKIYMENIQGANYEHFVSTSKTAQKLSSSLKPYEITNLIEASLLHDIGKVFIPPEILNKPSILSDEEKRIVALHSKLGFEILKTAKISPDVQRIVKLHHQRYDLAQKENYPAQILSVADVYSALKEKRPYKKQFTNEEIKINLENNPKLNPEIVKKIYLYIH